MAQYNLAHLPPALTPTGGYCALVLPGSSPAPTLICASRWWFILAIPAQVSHVGRFIGLTQKGSPGSLFQTSQCYPTQLGASAEPGWYKPPRSHFSVLMFSLSSTPFYTSPYPLPFRIHIVTMLTSMQIPKSGLPVVWYTGLGPCPPAWVPHTFWHGSSDPVYQHASISPSPLLK